MIALNKDILPVITEHDVVFFRNRVQEMAGKIKMSFINQTKLMTAASELARNMLKYAGGGRVSLEIVTEVTKTGIRLVFEDTGPGIENITEAMKDGYSTGKSLGLGLPGSKRLSDVFIIESEPGVGTKVTIIKWRNAF
jgi:serine/threonine-protein kinase RsbT